MADSRAQDALDPGPAKGVTGHGCGETREVAVMERLQGLEADDTKAIPGWKEIQKGAPKVWKMVKPVIQDIVSAAVKKRLDL